MIQIPRARCLPSGINVSDQSLPASAWCEALYRSSARQLVLYGRALGLTHGEAEDVLQETFLALLRRPQPPRDPAGYALRAYRNRARNHWRSLWRRLAREPEADRWFEPPTADEAATERARSALIRLPVEQREVIVLKVWHEMTFEAIGRLIGRSPNTVAGRYRYGLQKLRAALAAHTEHEHELDAQDAALLAAAGAVARGGTAVVW